MEEISLLISIIQVCLILDMFLIGFCQLVREFKDGFLIDLARAMVCISLIILAYFSPNLINLPYVWLFFIFLSVTLSTVFLLNWISKEYLRRVIRIKSHQNKIQNKKERV